MARALVAGHLQQQLALGFAVIEAGHLLARAAVGGAILVVDLRLPGFGLKEEPVSYLATTAQPCLIGGLSAALNR
jgi:hypothetical protein